MTGNTILKINFNSVSNSIFKTSFSGVRKNNSSLKMREELTQDVFQKSPINAECKVSWNNDRIQQIYDKTFKIVLKQNPITKELNMPKPNLVFSDENNETIMGTYNFGKNEITFYPNYKEDLYLITFGEGCETQFFPNIYTKQDIEELKKENELELKEMNLIKLTDKEKELYLSSVLAHEIRHCIQEHLVASTDTCADTHKKIYKDNFETVKTCTEKLIEAKKDLANYTGNPKDGDCSKEISDLKKYQYCINYKPKKLLDKNTKLKYSLMPDDNRYWSIQNHLLTSEIQDKNEEYYLSPREIDSFNYQYEFLISQTPIKFEKNIRENVVIMLAESIKSGKEPENILKLGYLPIETI